jgi:hypothetical protein
MTDAKFPTPEERVGEHLPVEIQMLAIEAVEKDRAAIVAPGGALDCAALSLCYCDSETMQYPCAYHELADRGDLRKALAAELDVKLPCQRCHGSEEIDVVVMVDYSPEHRTEEG